LTLFQMVGDILVRCKYQYDTEHVSISQIS
jgi:hypothetical protein